jgi:hypothetical protein
MLGNARLLRVDAIYEYFVAKFRCSDMEILPYSDSSLIAETPFAKSHRTEMPGAESALAQNNISADLPPEANMIFSTRTQRSIFL